MYDSNKLRETIKESIRRQRAVETPVGLRWHNTKETDYEYIYKNFESLSNADLLRLLRGTMYESVAVNL